MVALSGQDRNSLGGEALLEGLEGGVGSEDLEPHHTFCFFFFFLSAFVWGQKWELPVCCSWHQAFLACHHASSPS